jgi:hypothetical protein
MVKRGSILGHAAILMPKGVAVHAGSVVIAVLGPAPPAALAIQATGNSLTLSSGYLIAV